MVIEKEMIKNYYQMLGLLESATKDEIKSAFRVYATKFHPNKQNNDKFFEERFKEIKEAYDVLIDDNRRQVYDLKLKNQNSGRSSSTFGFSHGFHQDDFYYEFQKKRQKEEEEEKAKRQRVYYTSKNLLLNGLYINCNGQSYNLADFDNATIRKDDSSIFVTLGMMSIIVGILTITLFIGIVFITLGILALFHKDYLIIGASKTGDIPLLKGRKRQMKKIALLINKAIADNNK